MPGKAKLLFAGNKRPVWRSLRWDKEVFGGDYGSDPLPKSNLFCFGKICKNNMFLFQYIGKVRMCGKNCSRAHLRRKVTADFVPCSEGNRYQVGELRSFNWSASLSGTS